MAPRDRGSIRKVAKSGQSSRSGHRRSCRRDGGRFCQQAPWRCPSGKPWHQFVSSGCHAGNNVLPYGRTHIESTVERFRGPVGSDEPSISTVGKQGHRSAMVGVRDRKVVRAPDLCIGMSAGIMRVAAMAEARSNSPRADRPQHLIGCEAHISRSFQQAVVLMCKDVDM